MEAGDLSRCHSLCDLVDGLYDAQVIIVSEKKFQVYKISPNGSLRSYVKKLCDDSEHEMTVSEYSLHAGRRF